MMKYKDVNYIPEKGKFFGNMFSSAMQPPPRHNFVVSAITFEGFRLRSSNLTHALTHPNISDEFDNWHCRPIQNGRRWLFCQFFFKYKKFCINLKWPEMRSKANFGHQKSSVSIWNGQKCDQKWISDIQNGRQYRGHFVKKKCIKIKIVVSIWNGKKCDQKWFLDIQNGCHFKKKHLTVFELTAGR